LRNFRLWYRRGIEGTADNKFRETSERLALLLIAQPREGWEEEFEELIRREVERLAVPAGESGRDEHP
jgi:hypothetical protein